MKSRSQIPEQERRARSRLAKLTHDMQLIAGSMISTHQTCGKPKCRCKQGQKHPAVYVGLKYEGKRRMLSVAPKYRSQIQRAVDNYKEIKKMLDIVSEHCCERLLDKRR
jgi:hypothetical protein